MKRQDKFPETSTFHFFNANPHNRIGCDDCVARALSLATNNSWENIVREMTEYGIKYGMVFNDAGCIAKYLDSKHIRKMPQEKKRDGTKYTGKEFCSFLNKYYTGKSIIANIGGHHIVCFKEYEGSFKVWDTWNSTDGCIGNYWIIG